MAVADEQLAAATALCECTAAQTSVAAAAIVLRGCLESRDTSLLSGSLQMQQRDCETTSDEEQNLKGFQSSSASSLQPFTSVSNKIQEFSYSPPHCRQTTGRVLKDEQHCEYRHQLDIDALNTCMEGMHFRNQSLGDCKGPGFPLSVEDLHAVLDQERFDEIRAKEILDALEAAGTSLVARVAALQQLMSDLAVQRSMHERELHEMLTRSDQFMWLMHAHDPTASAVTMPETKVSEFTKKSSPSVACSGCPFMHGAARSAAQQEEQNNAVKRTSLKSTMPTTSPTLHHVVLQSPHDTTTSATVPQMRNAAHDDASAPDMHSEWPHTADMHTDHAWLLSCLQEICSGVLPLPTGTSTTSIASQSGSGGEGDNRTTILSGLLGLLHPTGSGICPVTGLSRSKTAGEHSAFSTCFHAPNSPIIKELDQNGLTQHSTDNTMMTRQHPCTQIHNTAPTGMTSPVDTSIVSTSTAVQASFTQHEMKRSASTIKLAPKITKHTQLVCSFSEDASLGIVVGAVCFAKKVAKAHQKLVELCFLRLQGCIDTAQAAWQQQLSHVAVDRFLSQQQVCVLLQLKNIVCVLQS